MNMHKIAKIAVVTNLILVLLFVYSNLLVWDVFNGNNAMHRTVFATHWGFNNYGLTFYDYLPDGSVAMVQGIFIYPNYPIYLFFVAITVNLFFIYKIGKTSNVH
jgi:hypothetical protein